MKSQKNPRAKRLLTAVAKSFNDAPIKVEEWNFALCPHPTETQACYLYEYSLKCDSVIAEAKKLRQRHVLSEANRKTFEKWVRLNPMPATQGIEPDTCCENAIAHCESYVLAGALKGGERDRWCERALKANPYVIVTTKLSYDLHFLGTCAHFPIKHWLGTSADRQSIPPRSPTIGADAPKLVEVEAGNVLETHEHKGDFRLDTSPKSSFSSTLTDSLEVS